MQSLRPWKPPSPGDTSGLQRLAEHILRCPFSLARVVRLTGEGLVIYRSESANQAWQASSTTPRLCLLASELIGSISQGMPKICTGRMSFVRSVIWSSIAAGSIVRVSGSVSAKTGKGLVDQNGVVRRDERVRRYNDLVTGIDAHRVKCRNQGGRSAGRSETAFGAQQIGIASLELSDTSVATAAIPSGRYGGFRGSLVPKTDATVAILANCLHEQACLPRGRACRSHLLSSPSPSDPARSMEAAAALWTKPSPS